ncbi:MAG TPA: tRNA pseudouridine(13) synthase TruD [Fimbriiglobus sp.]|jgi:tRNA pseudouridine13 synthase
MHHPAMSPPLLTSDLPGVGGRIKSKPDDFEVEEIPSYEPSGNGDHLFLWIEKRGVGSEYFTRTVAQRLGVHAGAIGTAGLKDRHAVSRQWVSVPKECEPNLSKLAGDGIAVLKVSRHENKLKPGHLRGNKFRILIRGADRKHESASLRVIDRIRTQGMPNYYGPQRFGREGSTADLGFQCLAGKQPKRIRPFLFKFALSAAQSLMFNEYLARRHGDGLLRTVLPGDVMMKWPFGGLFVAEDIPAEQARFDAKETAPGGPMFGSRTFAAAGLAAEREAGVLRDFGLGPASFTGFGKLVSGTRRHTIVYIDDLAAAWEADGLRLSFTLPAGSYATVLLREVMKADWDGEGEED